MATAPTYTKSGAKASSTTKLSNEVFGITNTNQDLIKQVYELYLSNNRTSSATTKRRGEVQGGGKKPWKQKGTGRARAGSIRSPIWRGGGITFGPTGEQNYKRKISTTKKREAIRQALSIKKDSIKVVDSMSKIGSKTKDFVSLLDKIGASGKILCIITDDELSIKKPSANITNLQLSTAKCINVYSLINADTIIISKDAVAVIEEWLKQGNTARVSRGDK